MDGTPDRWLYHVAPRAHVAPDGALPEGAYSPPSLAAEGFVHASFRPAVAGTVGLYFAGIADLVVLQIDPRRLDRPVDVVETPRGPMPHVHGPIPRAAIVAVLTLGEVEGAPDAR